MVRRNGEMLCLQCQPITEAIDGAAFAGDAAVEKIAGIKLQAWLGGGDLHRATTRGFDDARGEYQGVCGRAAAIQNEVVIVAVAVANLRVLSLIYSRSDRSWRPEVERRALHGCDLARRYQRGVDWRDRIGVDGEHVSQDVAGRVAGEIPIGMLRQIDGR